MQLRIVTVVKAILALVILSEILTLYHGNYCEGNCQGNGENYECGWFCRLLSNPNNVITAYGIIITILGFWFISTQIAQGDEGLRQTRRSVNAQIRSDRGVLAFWHSRHVPDRSVFEFSYKNIGHGPVTIINSGGWAKAVPHGAPIEEGQWVGVGDLYIPMESGAIMKTWADEGEVATIDQIPRTIGLGLPIPEPDRQLFLSGHDLIIRLVLLYTSPMRMVFQSVITLRCISGTTEIRVERGAGMRFDTLFRDASDLPPIPPIGIQTNP